MNTDHGYDFSRLTAAQQNLLTFQGWQIGSHYPGGSMRPQPGPRTVRKLIERGLVIPHEVQKGGLTVIEYEIPILVHMAWCEECSK